MASKATATTALLLALNLLFFTMANACGCACGSCPSPPTPKCPTPPNPVRAPPPPPPPAKCPVDALKLGVCLNVLDLIKLQLGKPPKEPCCSLLDGLVDAEVAVCLCTALKLNVLGINLDIPIDLSLLVNFCGKSVPSGFQCS